MRLVSKLIVLPILLFWAYLAQAEELSNQIDHMAKDGNPDAITFTGVKTASYFGNNIEVLSEISATPSQDSEDNSTFEYKTSIDNYLDAMASEIKAIVFYNACGERLFINRADWAVFKGQLELSVNATTENWKCDEKKLWTHNGGIIQPEMRTHSKELVYSKDIVATVGFSFPARNTSESAQIGIEKVSIDGSNISDKMQKAIEDAIKVRSNTIAKIVAPTFTSSKSDWAPLVLSNEVDFTNSQETGIEAVFTGFVDASAKELVDAQKEAITSQ